MAFKKTRILFTTSNFNTAGSGKVIYDLAKGLDPNKFEIEIACGNNDGAFFEVVESLGFPIHVFETKTKYKPYYDLLFRIWNISKFYKKHQFDIIHSWQWSSDWTEALAARLVGVKWLYTKKAMGFGNKHWYIKSYLANYIVTINEEMRAYFPNKRAQALIPLGIDTDYYNPELFKDCITVDASRFQIITVANLVPVKGVEVLISALIELNDKNIVLTIVGDNEGSYGEKLMQVVQDQKLGHQVKFLGEKIDVRPYIAKANLYVIPTLDEGRKEGMPMALLEAMSMGIPVLGSNISGINYVLKDFSDLLFPAADGVALSQKIKEIQNKNSREREDLGRELRTYCNSHFDLAAFIKNHEQLYSNFQNDR